MQKDQKKTGTGVVAIHDSNGAVSEPNSAHATKTVEKYVKKRHDKAKKQADEEREMARKSLWDWGSIKYVIL